MTRPVSRLIIGAGPFGPAMASYAKHPGINHVIRRGLPCLRSDPTLSRVVE